jgi:hypothetical protein
MLWPSFHTTFFTQLFLCRDINKLTRCRAIGSYNGMSWTIEFNEGYNSISYVYEVQPEYNINNSQEFLAYIICMLGLKMVIIYLHISIICLFFVHYRITFSLVFHYRRWWGDSVSSTQYLAIIVFYDFFLKKKRIIHQFHWNWTQLYDQSLKKRYCTFNFFNQVCYILFLFVFMLFVRMHHIIFFS